MTPPQFPESVDIFPGKRKLDYPECVFWDGIFTVISLKKILYFFQYPIITDHFLGTFEPCSKDRLHFYFFESVPRTFN